MELLIGLIGAFIGAAASLGGTVLVLRHELKRRWDTDRRDAYVDYLDATETFDQAQNARIAIMEQLIDGISATDPLVARNSATDPLIEEDESIRAERTDALRELAKATRRLRLYAPQKVLEAATDLLTQANQIPKPDFVEWHARPEIRELEKALLLGWRQRLNELNDTYVNLCRHDLEIELSAH